MRLGKKDARLGAVKLRMSNYVDTKYIAKKYHITTSKYVGHDGLVKDWGMLGNDEVGDCVIAGQFHNIMLWNAMQGRQIRVSAERTIQTYSELTGYIPGREDTDNGTDMQAAARALQRDGFKDDDGQVHKIAAYLGLHPGDYLQHMVAIYLFGPIGIGINFPMSARNQFNQRQIWKPVRGSKLDGGHYISGVSKKTNLNCVTWGRIQPLNAAFLKEYNDESIAYISLEMLNPEGKSVEGFDKESLLNDVSLFTGKPANVIVAEIQSNMGVA